MATGQSRGNQPSTTTTASTARAGSVTPEVKDDPALTQAANPDTPTVSPGTPGTRTVAVGTRAPDRAKPFLSEGMRNDLESHGFAVDPVSGARYEVDDDGQVYVTEKAPPAAPVIEEERTGAKRKVVDDDGQVYVTEKAPPAAPVIEEERTGAKRKVDVEVTPPATRVDPRTGVETVKDPVTGETRVTQPGSGVTTITESDGETRTVDDPRN